MAQKEIVVSALPVHIITPSSSEYIQLFFNKSDAGRLYGKRSDGTIFLIQGGGGGGINSVTAGFPLLATPGLNPVISITDAPIGDVLTGNGPGLGPTFQTPASPVIPTLAEVLTAGRNADAVGVVNDDSGSPSIELNARRLVSLNTPDSYIDYDNGNVFTGAGATEIKADFYSGLLYDNLVPSVDWVDRFLSDSASAQTLDWELLEITGAWTKNNVPILTGLNATDSLSFPETPAQQSSDLTIAVLGASIGDPVTVGYPPASAPMRTCYTAFVSAADVVTVRFNNYSALDVTPATGDFNVICMKLNP